MDKEKSRYLWSEFQTHVFHVAPSMGPTVLIINLQDRQDPLQKADNLTKPGNENVYV